MQQVYRSNFIEITLRHGCSPVNVLHIFRTHFPYNTSGRFYNLESVTLNMTSIKCGALWQSTLGILLFFLYPSDRSSHQKCSYKMSPGVTGKYFDMTILSTFVNSLQKHPTEVFYRKGVLINFVKLTGNTCARVSFLIGLQDSDLQHS